MYMHFILLALAHFLRGGGRARCFVSVLYVHVLEATVHVTNRVRRLVLYLTVNLLVTTTEQRAGSTPLACSALLISAGTTCNRQVITVMARSEPGTPLRVNCIIYLYIAMYKLKTQRLISCGSKIRMDNNLIDFAL